MTGTSCLYADSTETFANPDQLVSPGEVLARQAGHSYEMATLLTSLLIGASYNAFVVSGYATREICTNDTTRVECPYLIAEEQIVEEQVEQPPSKYRVEPPRDVRSQFLLRQEEKERAREAGAKAAKAQAELQALLQFESPPPDNLWTYRRHAWVLLLPSKDITEPCFLEAASGTRKDISDVEYHGIDSIWNHTNYWVAVGQDRLLPCKNMTFEMNDVNCWERLLTEESISNSKPSTNTQDSQDSGQQGRNGRTDKYLDMPVSWVSKINLSHSDYERRYVDCHKTVRYRKCVVEQLAPYSDNAGLVTRVTHFTDYECTNPRQVREQYTNRADLLYFISTQSSTMCEKFHQGRQDALKEHRYKMTERGLATELEMEFYSKSRQDGLWKLTKQSSLTEEFNNRPDYLYYRHTIFGEDNEQETTILKIMEKFHRNERVPYSEDVASVEYDLISKKVRIVYQYGEERISAATRELCLESFKLIAKYDPDPQAVPLRPLALHFLLQNCQQKKEEAEKNVRLRERELNDLLVKRAREMAEPELMISQFDEGRNQEARDRYKERDRRLKEEEEKDLRLSVDLLAPYLAQLPKDVPVDVLPAEEARTIYAKCLEDWKSMLLARAIDIQRQFELLCDELRNKPQDGGGKSSQYFKLHCLQVRLIRHKELAPQRYLAIHACLHKDLRLRNAFS